MPAPTILMTSRSTRAVVRSTRKQREARPLSDFQRLRWWCPMHPSVTADRPRAVCNACGGMVLKPRVISYTPAGQVLAVPASAVVDTGARKVVFVESMPGMFDGVEVVLGPRCGDFYPVVRGLEAGPAGRDRRRVSARRRDALEPQPRGRLLRSGPRRTSRCSRAARERDQAGCFRGIRRVSGARARGSPARRAPEALSGDEQAARLDGDSGAARRLRRGRLPVLRRLSKTRSKRDPAKYLAKLPTIDSVARAFARVTTRPMIDAIITFSIRHRALVIGASLVLAALGAWAAWETPVDAIPDLSENQVIVFTEWKGHGPREIEDQVTYPLTLGLRGLRGRAGGAVIERRRLLDDQRDLRGRRRPRRGTPARGRAAGSGPGPAARRRQRPSWRPTPRRPARSSGTPSRAAGFDLGRLRAIQDWYVRPQLGSVPGVADVSSVGGFPIEYQVVPDPNRLRVFGVSLKDVVEAVATSNAASGGHVVHKGNAEYVVRGVGRLGASPTPGDETLRRRSRRPRPGERRRAARRREARSGSPRSPRSRSGPASAAACSRKTATRSPAAWS